MLQSSPSHVRVPRLARTRAKVALILTSVCALVAAVLIPLTSHLNAQAATQVPGTIPSLEGWTPASGTWTPAGGLQIVHTDSAEAAGVSALLSRALADSGITGITDGTGAAPSTNAVSLTIDPSQSTLGDEGYQLTVTGNGAQVVAATRAGLLLGARTLEQAVRSGKGTVPTGSITDIPRFPDRGVTLCACGTHITPDWINRQIDRMSDLKMNYLSLELRIKSDKYPATTSFSYYTKDEVKAIVEHGREVGVRVVPLLNAPGHTGTILGNFPQFQVADDSGTKSANHLNFIDPAAQQFYFDLIDEYMDAFGSTEWHMGADEFFFQQGPEHYSKYLAQIRDAYGDQSMTFDAAFNDFINKVNAHVKSRGGTLRLWNDGIADISRTPIDKDVIIEYWAKGESNQKDANRGLPAKDLVDAGYTLVNASSALYYYRDQPSSYVMQVQGLDGVYGKWTMNSFYQNEGYAVPDASIRGGKVSIWQGGHGKVTDHETEAWIADGLRYGAQMFWNGKTPKADPDAQAFKARIDALGEPFTYTDPTRDTLTPGQYTITLADGQGLSVTGGTPTVGASSDNWELAATPDGYYQIRSVNSNRCLAVYSEDTPNSETHVSTTPGHPVVAYACADASQKFTPAAQGDYATRNPQKWVAEPAGDGFRLRNAMTNQYLSVIDSGYLSRRPNGGEKTAEGTVAQLPLDVTVDSGSVLTLTSQASSTLDVSIAREGDEAYPKNALSGMDRASLPIIGDDNWGESVLNVSVTNKGTAEVTGIHLTPSVSNSWVLANGPQPIDRLAPGETRVVKFWARPTTEFGEATFTVDVSYAGEKTVASEGLVGVCGPRIKAEAVAADSVETRWEYGEEYKATDGGPSTYWHSQYIDANNAKLPETDTARKWPHWIDLKIGDGSTGYDVCALSYTPRAGNGPKASGRVKDVQIYLAGSLDGLKGQGDNKSKPDAQGNPALATTLANVPGTVDIPVAGNGSYLRFRGTNAQGDVAETLTDVMSVAELGVRVGHAN